MPYYVGLDVSVKTTAVCIVDETGKVIGERSLATEPASLADWLAKTGLDIAHVGHEAGPLSAWPREGHIAEELPVVRVDARYMKAALAAMRDKTDRNDARGIAQMMRTGWYREVPLLKALSRNGYADRVGSHFGWTDKLGPAMRAAYLWTEELGDYGDEQVQTRKLMWNTMPEEAKLCFFLNQFDPLGFANYMDDCWDRKEEHWKELVPRRPGERISIAGDGIELAREIFAEFVEL
jgi:hypothetical protein